MMVMKMTPVTRYFLRFSPIHYNLLFFGQNSPWPCKYCCTADHSWLVQYLINPFISYAMEYPMCYCLLVCFHDNPQDTFVTTAGEDLGKFCLYVLPGWGGLYSTLMFFSSLTKNQCSKLATKRQEAYTAPCSRLVWDSLSWRVTCTCYTVLHFGSASCYDWVMLFMPFLASSHRLTSAKWRVSVMEAELSSVGRYDAQNVRAQNVKAQVLQDGACRSKKCHARTKPNSLCGCNCDTDHLSAET